MSVELVHSQPPIDTEQRLNRLQGDVTALRKLTRAEVRMVYSEIEALRDALSRILDRADDKNA